jgi:hypothetical protein
MDIFELKYCRNCKKYFLPNKFDSNSKKFCKDCSKMLHALRLMKKNNDLIFLKCKSHKDRCIVHT